MNITGTLINLYHVCKRELWLHANGIRMEHTSGIVADGKLLHETSYPQRAGKYTEIEIRGSKIDFYDAHEKVIHEIKRSDKAELAHEWQVKYYIWLMQQEGISGVTGILEYPRLRETKKVQLVPEDIAYLEMTCSNIEKLVAGKCPLVIDAPICRRCSYHDFCYANESGE